MVVSRWTLSQTLSWDAVPGRGVVREPWRFGSTTPFVREAWDSLRLGPSRRFSSVESCYRRLAWDLAVSGITVVWLRVRARSRRLRKAIDEGCTWTDPRQRKAVIDAHKLGQSFEPAKEEFPWSERRVDSEVTFGIPSSSEILPFFLTSVAGVSRHSGEDEVAELRPGRREGAELVRIGATERRR